MVRMMLWISRRFFALCQRTKWLQYMNFSIHLHLVTVLEWIYMLIWPLILLALLNGMNCKALVGACGLRNNICTVDIKNINRVCFSMRHCQRKPNKTLHRTTWNKPTAQDKKCLEKLIFESTSGYVSPLLCSTVCNSNDAKLFSFHLDQLKVMNVFVFVKCKLQMHCHVTNKNFKLGGNNFWKPCYIKNKRRCIFLVTFGL